jgi:hypothetical protein
MKAKLTWEIFHSFSTPIESAVQTSMMEGSSSHNAYAAESTGRVCSFTTWRDTGIPFSVRGERSQRRNDLSDEVDSSMGGTVGRTVVDLTKSL